MKPDLRNNGLSMMDTATVGLIQARAYRNLNREFGLYLNEFGLSMSEWAVLGMIGDGTELSQVEIAEALDVTPAMATKISSGLERQGYVARRESDTDNRVKRIAVTEAGSTLLSKVEPKLRRRMAELTGSVSRSDLEAYVRVIIALSRRSS